MSLPTLLETARKLLLSSLVLDIEFLGTKVRARLPKGYTLDIYYNATLQKYSYTIIKDDKRVIGWDNAPPIVDLFPQQLQEVSRSPNLHFILF